ncbi:MAG TPA: alpha/beta hydrolase domain-containing protein, partial [Polyangiales bacterium]
LVGGAGLRTDLGVKVFQYLSETDVRSPARRMADSDHFRSWEIAGSAHSSYVSDQYRTPLVLRDFGEQPWPPDCDQPPYSRVKGYHVINHQYDLLVRWVRAGVEPPTAPKLEFDSGEVPALVRDELGIVKGGIRLPDVEAPTALNTGINSGATFCVLYGTYQPFDAAKLHSLYSGKRQYVGGVIEAARAAQRAGYISRSSSLEYALEALFADVPPGD